eukprot:695023-Pyramimonas_sp.AAC.1
MLRQLGAALDLPGGVITWNALEGSQSRVHDVGAGIHILNHVFDFPEEGWQRKENNITVSPETQGCYQGVEPEDAAVYVSP